MDERVDDAALMAAIATRADRQAFAELFRRYAPKVKAHLGARGVPAGASDELTQEVMIVVWRKAALFDAAKGSLATWLYAISRNCLLNQLRHDRRHPVELEDPDTTGPGDDPAAGEQLVIDRERRRGLALSIERLPPEQREILLGSYWKGQTLQECADENRIPLGTAKTRARLALEHLRDLMTARSDE